MGADADVDYNALLRSLPAGASHLPTLIDALVTAWSSAYAVSTPSANLYEFGPAPWRFLFDFSSEAGGPQWDRTLAAWGLSAPGKRPRDSYYIRGYPSPYDRADRPLDKGHMVPHQVGGDLGPNIFPQDRQLNRGWSEQGKRYRAFERAIGRTPGTFFFCRLIYTDETDFPSWIELGTFRGALHVERFRNRFR